jgi:hypothetical protein
MSGNARIFFIPRPKAFGARILSFVHLKERGIPHPRERVRNDTFNFCNLSILCFRALVVVGLLFIATQAAHASRLNVPPDATEAIHLMYSGKPDQAIALAHKIEAARPEHPLGYLIEADIIWWKIYCKWSERKYNTIDAWSHQRPADQDDNADLALADKVIHLAEASIAKSDTAEMELYAGLGYASRARLLGLRFEKMPTARAGVEARRRLLRCLELDPDMADANLGLGLYNYYVDTLSTMAKVLRFFMGIPGGDKRDGLRQLETASTKGELTQLEARFNMAKNLRNYDRDDARALQAAAPLIAEYPNNSVFLLMIGDIEQKLGHNDVAARRYRAAAETPPEDAACAAQVQKLASEALASLGLGPPGKR